MRRAWHALAAYTFLSLVVTWPLARGLGRDVAGDFGDPVLNIWIIAWGCEQFLAILRGDFSRIATFFDANIFHPAPLTLAYSEHLIPQALQVLPVYAISGNPILAYNLVFLSTFALSGLGMYLFVRELTGSPLAAFVAGLLYAFAPYRFPQTPHIQVLSSQWMPFALYGFRRFFVSVDAEGRGGVRPLAGAAGALVLQNLSCGYYLLYFSPFAAAYVLWEIAHRRLWRHWRVWSRLSAAAVGVTVITVPFLLPYAAVRSELGFTRARSEVIRYSADVYSYGTSVSTLWGDSIRAYPKPEGDLFFGFVPLLLAAVGVAAAARSAGRGTGGRYRWLTILLGVAAVLHFTAAIIGLLYRRVLIDLGPFDLQISNINQMLLRAVILTALLILVSRGARERARLLARNHAFFLLGLIAAMWLSLGPLPQALGRPAEIASPYGFLYEHLPGFEGVRVPARFAMVAVLMLAVLGGLGAAVLAGRRRAGQITLLVLSGLFIAEGPIWPFPRNVVPSPPGYATPEARLYRPARAPEVYREIARLPADAVIVELPLEPDFDIRAMYYSLSHGRALLNGYSGFYPPHYGALRVILSDAEGRTEEALGMLRMLGATHAVVHEEFYLQDRGQRTTAALMSRGATELYRAGNDVLLQLP